MSDTFPCKEITLDEYTFRLHGIGANDPYWNSVHDNFEPDFHSLCRRLVQPDYVCFDIGANIGVKTLFLSRHCPQGRIIAIEAGANAARCLAANIASNGAHNAASYHAAAAGYDGRMTFDETSAWGHESSSGGIDVEALTLDTLAARYHLSRLDFIKIDVEGGELPILRHSLGLINHFESLVHVEFNSLTLLVWGNTNPREFIEWLCANFRFVYAVNRRDFSADLLTEVTSDDSCRAILYRNLIDDGCFTDLVVSNAERRFTVTERDAMRTQLSKALCELDAARAERDAARAERDGARAERDALLTSTSWRWSAPARWLKLRLSPH